MVRALLVVFGLFVVFDSLGRVQNALELRHAQTADGQQAFALLREQFQQLADQRETAQDVYKRQP